MLSKSIIDNSRSIIDNSRSIIDNSGSIIDSSRSIIDNSRSSIDEHKFFRLWHHSLTTLKMSITLLNNIYSTGVILGNHNMFISIL